MPGFGLFILVMIGLALVFRVDALAFGAYLLAGIYILSRLWVQRMKAGIETQQRFTDHLFAGESLEVTFAVKNKGFLPVPWIEVHFTFPIELTSPIPMVLWTLNSHERKEHQYSVLCRRRGYYPIGPLQLHYGDILRIVPRQLYLGQTEYITVYPQIVPLQSLGLPTRSPLATIAVESALFEDTARVVGVREYQVGDSPRHIHWTTSANANQLMVKRFQPAIARDALICLNMNPVDYPNERKFQSIEIAVIGAASIANHIITREKQSAGLLLDGIDQVLDSTDRQFYLPPHAEPSQLIHLLEVLARIQPTTNAFEDLVRSAHLRLKFGMTLVILTGQETESLISALFTLRRAGIAIALVLFQPSEVRHTELAVPKGITCYRLRSTLDLENGLLK